MSFPNIKSKVRKKLELKKANLQVGKHNTKVTKGNLKGGTERNSKVTKRNTFLFLFVTCSLM